MSVNFIIVLIVVVCQTNYFCALVLIEPDITKYVVRLCGTITLRVQGFIEIVKRL